MTDHSSELPLRALYQEIILEHYRRPRNRGELEDADVTVHKNNPTCGDQVTLQLRLDEGRIVEGRFGGHGCSISQASTSMMTDLVRGKSADEARALGRRFREMLHGSEEAAKDRALGDLRALSGVAKFPPRVRCALLGWDALEKSLSADSEAQGL